MRTLARLRRILPAGALAVSVACVLACSGGPDAADPGDDSGDAAAAAGAVPDDPHSFARPAEARVTHLDLDLAVDFAAQRLAGTATLAVAGDGDEIVLDTRALEIEGVTLLPSGEAASWELGDEVPFLGRPLTVALPEGTEAVRVAYRTTEGSDALQWLAPEGTATGEHPFLFTQSQAILARTWVPCQDTPSVRMTYAARVRVPSGLLAVMSAENPTEVEPSGVYSFRMPQAIPSYLLALAVGRLEFRPLGPETGVYAEPPVVEKAAWEFAETQAMVDAVEEMYGPYRWGRYDLLVLPPSFPFGGMENPRLTFVTPTVLAGDRSLVALVAHELAHSWSGNLATNATWDDFWLNEGFTVYLERRIMEQLYGRELSEMQAELGFQDLAKDVGELPAGDTRLHLDLAGRDPDEGMTDVAYEKGYLFLRRLEEATGRERFDVFLRRWFDEHAFEPVTTEELLAALEAELAAAPAAAEVDLEAWAYGEGIPEDAPRAESEALDRVEAEVERFAAGTPAAELATEGWATPHWLHFLRHLPRPLADERLADLDAAFGFTGSGNSEILFAWLMQAVANDYRPAYGALEAFLTGMGRRKFLEPLYKALVTTDEGRAIAERIYEEARPGYHPVSQATIDEVLGRG